MSRSYGFPNSIETYGLVSGLWTSTFALGAFIGPSVAGILLDNIGFRNGSMFIILLHMLVVCIARFALKSHRVSFWTPYPFIFRIFKFHFVKFHFTRSSISRLYMFQSSGLYREISPVISSQMRSPMFISSQTS